MLQTSNFLISGVWEHPLELACWLKLESENFVRLTGVTPNFIRFIGFLTFFSLSWQYFLQNLVSRAHFFLVLVQPAVCVSILFTLSKGILMSEWQLLCIRGNFLFWFFSLLFPPAHVCNFVSPEHWQVLSLTVFFSSFWGFSASFGFLLLYFHLKVFSPSTGNFAVLLEVRWNKFYILSEL